MEIAKEINGKTAAKVEELDEGLIKELSYQATGDLAPMQSVIGGITAQEVMKVCVLLCLDHMISLKHQLCKNEDFRQ